MRKVLLSVLGVILVGTLFFSGCGRTPQSESGKDAISVAQSLSTDKEKVDYLIKEAKAFYNSKEFQQAIDIAQYILKYLDNDSQEAKSLLEKAKEQLQAQVEGAVGEATKKLGSFGN